jgi:hypothetical protein
VEAVIAAIGAAVLAGGIAIYREWRRRLRGFQIAARVLYATFGVAVTGANRSREQDRWDGLRNLPGVVPFSAAWETYKGDLAGDLTWKEWVHIARAAERYLSVLVLSSAEPGDPPSSLKDFGELEELLLKGREVLAPYCKRPFGSPRRALRLVRTRLCGEG